ncbi:MAG TPA: TetR/AcrR family transcriptional regulator [Streptosporangiaceae bacterium]|nr:TetR/AcrR family transcriptional regulator [Streptosporangiaceae bacterium]
MSTSIGENTGKRYHHGHLREALVQAGLATARAEGPGAVALRAATRAAGVSPNAAYRHFADRDDLLQAVAACCQERMAALVQTRLDEAGPLPGPEGAWQRLRTAGRAYVEFALAEPGWFATGFAIPLDMPPDGPTDDFDLFAILVKVLDELVSSGAIAPEARPGAEYVAWAAVHGIATLLTEGSLRNLPPTERDAAIDRVINAVAF